MNSNHCVEKESEGARYFLNHNTNMNEVGVKFYIAGILIGLDYIHEKNWLHKDLKPDNLLIDHTVGLKGVLK